MEKKKIIAICYDFDKTLSPENMQEQGFIQAVGHEPDEFWRLSNDFAAEHDGDANLAYMYLMLHAAAGKFKLTRDLLRDYGNKVRLYPGVENWFERTSAYAASRGWAVEHYIISSGLKEMIEGTTPARNSAFTKIYAGSFCYDRQGQAFWPAQTVNYTEKTQYLFRISKGVLDVNDTAVNNYYRVDELRVPFQHMIYIGDSETDIPCMKLISSNGGYSIGVYNPVGGNQLIQKIFNEGRINYYVPADYRPHQKLDCLIKKIIDLIISVDDLNNYPNG